MSDKPVARVRYDMGRLKYAIAFPSAIERELKQTLGRDDDVMIVYLPDEEAINVVQALLKQGVEVSLPQSDTFLSGKLEATELHLKDMRRLVMLENEKGEVE